MSFVSFILRNMLGRPTRTALTVLGLGVGIAAVMLLTGISWGLEASMTRIYTARGIDLIVVRAGLSDQLSSNLDEALVARLAAVPGVAAAESSLMDAVSFEEANLASVLTNGWTPGGLLMRGLRVIEGAPIAASDERQAMLGRVLALNLNKKVGDDVLISGEPFRVVEIYESDSLFENGGLVVSLGQLQRMMGRRGQVTGFVVVVAPGADARAVGRAIEAQLKGVAAFPARAYVDRNVQLGLARAIALATIGVALILGSIGLLNTMATAVFERTREIGLLRALGWKRRRIVALLLGETLALGAAGVVAGGFLAVVGMRLLMLSPTSRGFIDPTLPPAAFGIGLALGVGLSLLGGAYPALRAARLEPTEALRHD